MIKNEQKASYVLVSVAYNEEKQIKQVLECVIKQSILPKKWVIISDGSTDQTDQIIKDYADKYAWINFERLEKSSGPIPTIGKASFAYSRAMAKARKILKETSYDFLANLDVDITFDKDYYEKVMEKALEDDKLGITGGGGYSVLENGTVIDEGFIQPDFVGGPLQFFRRQCLDDIDGYKALDHADVVAVFMARMKGWKVKCFPEIRAFHHGQSGNSVKEKIPICFQLGQVDYVAGCYLPFVLGRCTLRLFRKPYFLAGISMFCGYVWAALRRMERRIPRDLMIFMRKDQKSKILEHLKLIKKNPFRV